MCVPRVSKEVVQLAMPVAETNTTLQSASGTPFSVKLTVPASATEPPLGLMVAVRVTGSLTADGFTEETNDTTELVIVPTTCAKLLLLLL